MEALYREVTAKRELERSFEDMVQEIQHLIEQMDDERAPHLPRREPVPQHREVRERQARGVHEETRRRSSRTAVRMSLNYPRHPFQCTWPWSTLVMLCDGRMVCGCADPVRQARARRRARRTACQRRLDRRDDHRRCARDLNAGGSRFCGDCPLKLPLKKDEAPPVAAGRRRRAAVAAVHRVHGRLQHLVHPGVLRAGNRHHAHAPGRHARLRSVPRVIDEAGPSLGPHRLLQLRRSVPAQARGRDVRVHQDAASRTSISTRAPTAWRSPRRRRGGSCTRASTR